MELHSSNCKNCKKTIAKMGFLHFGVLFLALSASLTGAAPSG